MALARTLDVNNRVVCSDSSGKPFCTIAAAVAKAAAGDTVQVAAGTYPGTVYVTNAGKWENPIAIVTTHGAIVKSKGHGFDLSSVSWINIEGFTVSGVGHDAIRCVLCAHVTLKKNVIVESKGRGIAISDSHDVVLSQNRIRSARFSGIEVTGSTLIRIGGGLVTRSGRRVAGKTFEGIRFVASSASRIMNTEVFNNSDSGIALLAGTTNVRITGVKVHHNARQYERAAVGIEISGPKNTVESSRVYRNEDAGVAVRSGGHDVLIASNMVYRNGDQGIDVLESRRPVIVNNSVYRNVAAGINLDGNSYNGSLINNMSADNGIGSPRTNGNIRVDMSSVPETANRNLVHNSKPGILYVWKSKPYRSLARLKSDNPGIENSGIQAPPKWANPDRGNFHLTYGSAAVDSAKSDSSAARVLGRDAKGNTRCDIASVPNTGSGTITYMDRGALELAGICKRQDHKGPSVPKGLGGTAASTSRIDLGWNASTDNVGVTGYKIFRNGGSAPIATVTSTSYSNTGLSANTSYSYTVLAFDAAGNDSAQSSAISVKTKATPDTQAPSIPGGFGGVAISSTRIDLDWNASTDNVGVAGYKVFRNGASAPIATVTNSNYSNTGLNANTTYSYKVLAFDAGGNESAQTSSISVKTKSTTDTQAPSVPGGLGGTAVSTSQIDLDWIAATDNVGVTGYKVFRNGGSAPIATVTGTSFSNTGLNANTTYSYKVLAFDAGGNESVQSGSVSVKTGSNGDTQAPSVPVGLGGTAVTTSQIDLNWNAAIDNVGVTGYKVFRNGGSSPIATVTGTSFSNTGLSANTTYSYKVLAFDAAGNESAQSSSASVKTQAGTDTQAPSVPGGLGGVGVSSSQINLDWSASSDNVGVTGYKVFRDGGSTPIATVTSTSFSNTGLSANTSYSYAVLAFDAAGNESSQSSAVSVQTQSTSSSVVMVGAGDIAYSSTGDTQTAALVDQVIAANPSATVFTLGDNAYEDGTASEFTNYYAPTWGKFKSRTKPAPGNHDYHVSGAPGYYGYFGSSAGPSGKGYYSYDLGAWHIISLNSETSMSVGSAQETWLRADLVAHPSTCIMAYWHKPLFTSGTTDGPTTATRPLWQALYEHGADLILNGHEHNYERFAPQTPTGSADSTHGIRQIVAGTAGNKGNLYSFGSAKPNSQVRNSTTFGVLKLTLNSSSYSWQFIPVAGKTFTDGGTTNCSTTLP